MTYCVGLYLNQGLVLLSDTRTNAGVDHISTFGKMHVEEIPGERMIAMLTSGNLAISQAVWNRLQEGVWLDGQLHTLRDVPTMFRAAQLTGQVRLPTGFRPLEVLVTATPSGRGGEVLERTFLWQRPAG